MMGGTKHDKGKPHIGLIPNDALESIAEVLEFGAKKYNPWNWTGGFEWSRLIDSTYRHLGAWKEGEDKDPESGLSHAAHAACCLVFLLVHERRGLGEDNRFNWTLGDTNNNHSSSATEIKKLMRKCGANNCKKK